MDILHLLRNKERILVNVKPNSSKTEILNYIQDQDIVVIAVKAVPVDGKANQEIEKFFSKLLKKKVTIKSGRSSKKKTLIIN